MREPKLEIYKIKLINKTDGRPITFRELFRKKFKDYRGLTTPIELKDIFKLYHADFLEFVSGKKYKVNKAKSKGFTIAYDEEKGKPTKTHICPPFFSEKMILDGVLEGGKHGTLRWLGEVEDTTKRSTINENNTVNDRYYFLIYSPLELSQGVVMIQGYTESKISDVFREYLSQYFSFQKEIKSQFEIFVPETFRQRYLEKAVFKKLMFTSGWHISSDFEDAKEKEYELEVKIEIIDKSPTKSNYKKAGELLEKFGKSLFKPSGGSQKELKKFEKINAKMVSNGKELPLQIDNEDAVTPVILLSNEGITVTKGVPDFVQINSYCRNLIDDIDSEIRPSHAIKSL